jgi:RNA polymerase sigma-70 factor, ECF subfamily
MQSSGVTECFEGLVTQHQREIYYYIRRLTKGADEAEDLFQETFLRAYKAYTRLPQDANVRAWLFKIATNLCRNYFRSLKRQQNAGLHEGWPSVERVTHAANGATPDDPEQHLLWHDLERHVLALITELPVKQKAALIQRKLHGLPYDSIAASLQCSPDTARAHVFQALKKIRTELAWAPRGSRTSRRTDNVDRARDAL